MRTHLSLKERLTNAVSVNGAGCWVWNKSLSAAGYGVLTVGSRNDGSRRLEYAHRVSFSLFKAELEDGLTIDHLCRNRACLNPDHLEQVTNMENVRRGNGCWKQNANKTHCIRGHEFDAENTRVLPSKYGFARRQCKECEKVWRANKKRNKQLVGTL